MQRSESFSPPRRRKEGLPPLDSDGQARLGVVMHALRKSGTNIEGLITEALQDITDTARREYLRNQLTIRARIPGERVRKKRIFSITDAMREDAHRHEEELIKGIPEDDL